MESLIIINIMCIIVVAEEQSIILSPERRMSLYCYIYNIYKVYFFERIIKYWGTVM